MPITLTHHVLRLEQQAEQALIAAGQHDEETQHLAVAVYMLVVQLRQKALTQTRPVATPLTASSI
jgi:hypothetical protein